MINLNRARALAAIVVGMQFCLPAWSTDISEGHPVVFNFSSPTPGSFTNIAFTSGISFCSVAESQASHGCSGVDAPDNGAITAFTELDGAGASNGIGFWSDSSFTGGFDFVIRPDLAFSYFAVDGVFSSASPRRSGTSKPRPTSC